MTNKELMAFLIIKNSPNMTFKKSDLVRWLISHGKQESHAKSLVYTHLNDMPIKKIIDGKFKLLVDPSDFETHEPQKKEATQESKTSEIKEIIEFLNMKTGSKYKAGATHASKINARLKEGFTVDDFKAVIEKKTKEWLGTNFENFLRPETLFGTKFESYLNQNTIKRPESKSAQMAGYDFSKYIKGG